MSPAARAPLIWVAAAYLAQLILAASLPTVADEAYYTAWGQSLALGYLDHPPLVALWSAYGGRALNAVVTPITLWLFVCTGKRLGIQKSLWFPALFSLTPLGLAAGVLITPDIPLLFSSALLLWAWSTERGLLVGFAFAVGLSSKALILFYLPGLLLTMRVRQSVIALLFALLIYSPQLYWSLHHEGYPWRFQFGRTMLGPHPLHLVFTQLLCIGPLLVPAALAAVVRSFSTLWRRCSISEVNKRGGITWRISRLLQSVRGEKIESLWLFSLPPTLLLLIGSFVTRIEGNWSALVWPPALLILLRDMKSDTLYQHLRWGALLTAPLLLLPLIHQLIPLSLGPPRDGHALLRCLETDHYRSEGSPLPLVTIRYQEQALLEQAGASPIYLRPPGRRKSQYDLWERPQISAPRCGFLAMSTKRERPRGCQGYLQRIQSSCHPALWRCTCFSSPKREPIRVRKEGLEPSRPKEDTGT